MDMVLALRLELHLVLVLEDKSVHWLVNELV